MNIVVECIEIMNSVKWHEYFTHNYYTEYTLFIEINRYAEITNIEII